MKYVTMTGTTDSSGNLVVTRNLTEAMYVVKVRWLAGDFIDGVDATLVAEGSGGVVVDRTILTLTNANDDAWHDITEDGDGIVDQQLTLSVSSGGSAKSGGCIVYLADAVASGGGGAVSIDSPLAVTTSHRKVTAAYTRPSNTTAYTAGDTLNNSTTVPVVLTFADVVAANGGAGRIVSAKLVDSASQGTKPQLELWLYAASAAPGIDNDNAAYTPTDAELLTLVDVIDFSTGYVGDATSGAGGNLVFPARNLFTPFICDAANNDLFGIVVVRNAYSPVSAEVFTFDLWIEGAEAG